MATIVTRAGKGSPLTNAEVDANFSNLNDELATALFGANNLSDLGNVSTARSNLGVAIGSDVQAWDADLDAIAALTGTSGLLKKTAANTWSLDTSAYLTGIDSSMVTTALGFTPYNATNPSGYISSINSSMVTTALGFTPYNATNPSGYITSSALSSYLPLTGGTLTGALTLNGGDLKAYRAGGTTGAVYLNSAGTNYLYWDGANYNMPSGNLSLGGSLTATGNVTAYSDESLKKDWADMPHDFVEKLATLKHGTYTRIDSGDRQVGVSAQGLRVFLQEAVVGEDVLSVAYGNAALVACVQLAQKQLAMQERLNELEQKVGA